MEQHGISKLDLKRRNRMQVLKILKQYGPTSRIDIAGTLELTRAAVTIITNEMIDQGIIAEIGEYKHVSEKAPRGRKKILIDINHHYKFALGITVEDDTVSVGLSTLSGDVLDKRNIRINETTERKAIYSFFVKSMNEILTDNCLDQSALLGIGFAIFPTMYSRMDVSIENGEPDFSKLQHFMSSYTSLPMVFDNSVKGMAMANIDFRKDFDPDRRNVGFLQYGKTLNYVFANINEPIIAYDNRTDFVNKMIINPSAEQVCECGRKGCVESEIAPDAVLGKIYKVFSKEQTPFLWQAAKGDKSAINKELICASYGKKDQAVVDIIDRAYLLMAVLVNNLYLSSNPERIVLHKFYFSGELSFDKFKESVAKIGGERVANAVHMSVIEEKHRFLSGCALVIRELFYNCGGYLAPQNARNDADKETESETATEE
jgi:predicted NBD/HSP70 family sugar kinase